MKFKWPTNSYNEQPFRRVNERMWLYLDDDNTPTERRRAKRNFLSNEDTIIEDLNKLLKYVDYDIHIVLETVSILCEILIFLYVYGVLLLTSYLFYGII